MRVVWSRPARVDLREIGLRVAEDDPRASLNLIRRIRASVARLADHPGLGRPGRVAQTRELVIARTSYIVPYGVRGDHVVVFAVFHKARQWPESFKNGTE